MKKIFALLLLAALLCGCNREGIIETLPPTTPTETTTPATEPETEPPTEPPKITVYEGATVDYLEPFDEYSWPQEFPPEFVMIHFCSAVVNHPDDPYNYDYVRQTFTDAGVSIHYLVDRDGTVYCFIPEDRSAWHAGKGQWQDDEKYTNNLNRYSIGIELMGMGTQEEMSGYLHDWQYKKLDDSLKGFTDAQYEALAALVEDICQRHNIAMDRQHIIGHDEFSPKKKDPGDLFDWSRILPEA